MHREVVLAGLLTIVMSGRPSASNAVHHQDGRTAATKKAPAIRVDEYRVPAGSALLLKLRTPLSSASSSVDQQVEATLWSPVYQDGVELIPDGSVLIGKVLEVVPATRRKPLGSITFAFSIIEHATTKSLAMVTTQKVVFTAQPPQTGKKGKQELVEAIIPEDTSFIAMTADALLVRVPK